MTGDLGSSSKIVALFFPLDREVDTRCQIFEDEHTTTSMPVY